jgi:hypothetical protein
MTRYKIAHNDVWTVPAELKLVRRFVLQDQRNSSGLVQMTTLLILACLRVHGNAIAGGQFIEWRRRRNIAYLGNPCTYWGQNLNNAVDVLQSIHKSIFFKTGNANVILPFVHMLCWSNRYFVMK